EVRGGRAVGQDAAPCGRQAEEVAQPVERDRLELGGQRARLPGASGLVEQNGEPVGGGRGGRRAADHPVEEARPAGTNVRLRPLLEQPPDRRERAVALLRERAGEGAGGLVGGRGADRAVELGEVGPCALEHELERGEGVVGRGQRIGQPASDSTLGPAILWALVAVAAVAAPVAWGWLEAGWVRFRTLSVPLPGLAPA